MKYASSPANASNASKVSKSSKSSKSFLSFGSSLIRKSSITSVCKSFAPGGAPNIIITYTHGEIKERYKTVILRDIVFSKLEKKLEKEL